MAPQNALILRYSHLDKLPRAPDALHTIKRIASLVKPIMRARNWKVGTLSEFYPIEGNLLGINKNRGEQICLRLRYATDHCQFLPFEQVVDTMLHELCHNVFGPHDAKFHALWDQLRSEYEALILKGYTGEGFLSEGRVLGGRKIIPIREVRRIAREAAAAAEKRLLDSGPGRKLGGLPASACASIRDVILDALQRRTTVLNGCGAGRKDEREIGNLAHQATKNGFASQAEEDEANECAIAQALWELVQEDRERKSQTEQPRSNATVQKPFSRSIETITQNATKKIKTMVKDSPLYPIYALSTPSNPPSQKQTSEWSCPTCTLCNPRDFLVCSACNTERPIELTRLFGREEMSTASRQTSGFEEKKWTCSRCTMKMEDKWWTCSACGKLKDRS
ncbi:hypothetical protein K3495_g6846 [Podosphaera aphanis]|nr:hypothetical protein K3495_g6846 [Podosphaera aphanis]